MIGICTATSPAVPGFDLRPLTLFRPSSASDVGQPDVLVLNDSGELPLGTLMLDTESHMSQRRLGSRVTASVGLCCTFSHQREHGSARTYRARCRFALSVLSFSHAHVYASTCIDCTEFKVFQNETVPSVQAVFRSRQRRECQSTRPALVQTHYLCFPTRRSSIKRPRLT